MKSWHGILIGLIIGYVLGIYFPGPGAKLKSTVSGAVGAAA